MAEMNRQNVWDDERINVTADIKHIKIKALMTQEDFAKKNLHQ